MNTNYENTGRNSENERTDFIGRNAVAGASGNEKGFLDDSTTYKELVRILRDYPEAVKVAGIEIARKAMEMREAKRKAVMGEDYEESAEAAAMEEKYRRPRWNQLRACEGHTMIARKEMTGGAFFEVFSNGYAIYYSLGRHAILWIPEYLKEAYTYFHPLGKKEKQYMNEYDRIGGDELADQPWYIPLTLFGEDVIWKNMQYPRSQTDLDEAAEKEIHELEKRGGGWIGGTRFMNPEEAYIRKEEQEELYRQVGKLKAKQKEAIELCYFEECTQEQAAKKLGIAQSSLNERLANGRAALAGKLG